MTQEDKKQLFNDISARLPYNLVIHCTNTYADYNCFLTTDILHEIQNSYEYYDYKPYLRPMSSMTDEEKKELKEEHKKDEKIYAEVLEKISNGDESARGTAIPHFAADWCNAHHFDYRIVPSTGKTMIDSGLAIEAPEGMYKTE